MRTERTALDGVYVIEPSRHVDARGFLSEVWNETRLREVGIETRFVQENHTYSALRSTLRGLHIQVAPARAAKLIRCTRGSVFDVAVDLRPSSPTYTQAFTEILSADNWLQLYIPEGFAHGFCTLEDATEVAYMVSAHWSPDVDRGIRWNDPRLSIDWPLDGNEPILSDKDANQPLLDELEADLI